MSTLLHKSTASPELHIACTGWRLSPPPADACAHFSVSFFRNIMASGMISAQQFEAGARSFAALWETCTDAHPLWTWHGSGHALVSSWDPGALDRANKQHAVAGAA